MNELIMFYVAIPSFIVTMILEFWWIHKRKTNTTKQIIGYELKDTAASLTMGLGYLGCRSLWKLAEIPFYFLVYEMRLFEFDATLLAWVAIFVLQDFCYYWYHRFSHESRILWAGHVNHHSSQHYNLSTALRQSWTSYFSSVLFYIPIPLLGFHPIMLGTAALLHLFYQYWIHTEAIGKLGWLEHIFMTPSHHRVHHATNEKYLDRNHGGLFIFWDKLFGTFAAEETPPVYGITKNLKSFNPIIIAFHEYRDIYLDLRGARSIKHALGYVFMPPGWSPQSTAEPKQDRENAYPKSTSLTP